MKNRTWALILSSLALFSGIVGIFLLLPSSPAATAQIYSQGVLIKTVDLRSDQQFQVSSSEGRYNVITVKSGKIAVTAASCPDHCCVQRGFCNSGAPIICLPNALEIRFSGSGEPDISIG